MKTARELFAGLVAGVPAGRHPRGRQRLRVLTALSDAIVAGWPGDSLVAAVLGRGSYPEVGSVGAIIEHRLSAEEIGDPPQRASAPSQRAPRPECTRTDCDGHGYLTAGSGTVACPTCRPSVHATQLKRAGAADLEALLAKVNT